MIDLFLLFFVIAIYIFAHLSLSGTDYPYHPMVDAYTYVDQARGLLNGENPFVDGLYQPAVYPLFLWAIFSIFGEEALETVRIVQGFLCIVSAFLIYLCGVRLNSKKIGRLAALIYVLNPYLILFANDYLSVVLSLFLICFTLYFLLSKRNLVAGFGAGLMVLTHPVTLLFALIPCFRRGMYALALVVTLCPQSIYNYHHGGWTLVSHNSGINFFLGNGKEWEQTHFLRPGIEFRNLVLDARPASRTLKERNTYWYKRSLLEISERPIRFLRALQKKFLWSMSHREIPRNEDYRCRLNEKGLKWVNFLPVRWFWIFPLALIGGATIYRKQKSSLPLYWFALHLPLILFLVSDRYRILSLPIVALLGSIAFLQLPSIAKRQGYLFLLFLLPWVVPYPEIASDWCLHSRANIDFMEERWESAQNGYEKVLLERPENPDAKRYLAEVHLKRGNPEQAIFYLELLRDEYPQYIPNMRRLAVLYESQAQWERAIEIRRNIFTFSSQRIRDGRKLLLLLKKRGQEEAYRSLLEKHPELR